MTQQAKGHEFNENDIFENNENDYIIFFLLIQVHGA